MQKFTLMMLTCDKYSDIWPAYFGQLRKYWPQYTGEIFVNTESKRVENLVYSWQTHKVSESK